MQACHDAARPIFTEIKANNDRLEDPAVKNGLLVLFREGDEYVDLPTALDAVTAGDRAVTMIPYQYVKASKWLAAAALCIGGSVPYLNDVALKSLMPIGDGAPIEDVAALQKAWADTQML